MFPSKRAEEMETGTNSGQEDLPDEQNLTGEFICGEEACKGNNTIENCRLGIALSGGGLRATFFHLGVIDFLRSARILTCIEQITSVSGGSITATHLCLNWDAYDSVSDEEYLKAARTVIRVGALDMRGSIVRRLLTIAPLILILRVLLWPLKKFTGVNPGILNWGASYLLESYYNRHITNNKLNSNLPEKPNLHVLMTNLTNGGACSLTRQGFSIDFEPDAPDLRSRLIRLELLPLAKALAASSAFPALFPPIAVTSADIRDPNFQPLVQFMTDGGVFDNLGVRKFHQLMEREGGPDRILVVDAGLRFRRKDSFPLKDFILGTALRSTDIMMDRVNDLEREAVEQDPKFVFINIYDCVDKGHVLPPEVQKDIEFVRTDLDYFPRSVIFCLMAHGYHVAKSTMSRQYPQFNFDDCNPTLLSTFSISESIHTAQTKKRLRKSLSLASRRPMGIFSHRDWVSWFHLVATLFICIFIYSKAELVTELLKPLVLAWDQTKIEASLPNSWEANSESADVQNIDALRTTYKPLNQPKEPNYASFEFKDDIRVFDLRRGIAFDDSDSGTRPVSPTLLTRQLSLVKIEPAETILFDFRSSGYCVIPRCRNRNSTVYEVSSPDYVLEYETRLWQLEVDVSDILLNQNFQLTIDAIYWNGFSITRNQEWAGAQLDYDVPQVLIWILLPDDRPFESYSQWLGPKNSLLRVPESGRLVAANGNTRIHWALQSPVKGYQYAIEWKWKR